MAQDVATTKGAKVHSPSNYVDWTGLCPECVAESATEVDYISFVDAPSDRWWKGNDWMMCTGHKTIWRIGSGCFSSPYRWDNPVDMEEVAKYRQRVEQILTTCRLVSPVFVTDFSPGASAVK